MVWIFSPKAGKLGDLAVPRSLQVKSSAKRPVYIQVITRNDYKTIYIIKQEPESQARNLDFNIFERILILSNTNSLPILIPRD